MKVRATTLQIWYAHPKTVVHIIHCFIRCVTCSTIRLQSRKSREHYKNYTHDILTFSTLFEHYHNKSESVLIISSNLFVEGIIASLTSSGLAPVKMLSSRFVSCLQLIQSHGNGRFMNCLVFGHHDNSHEIHLEHVLMNDFKNTVEQIRYCCENGMFTYQ